MAVPPQSTPGGSGVSSVARGVVLASRRRTPGAITVRVDHFVLTVSDVDAACAFYDRIDGVEPITFGSGRRALRVGEQKINLREPDPSFDLVARNATVGSGDFCVVTETPLSAVAASLEEAGVDIVEGPVDRPGAGVPIVSIYFRDPDGNLVEIANER